MPYRLIFAAALAILGLFLVFANISLRRERNELKTALSASVERVEQLKADMKRQADALAERETKITRLASEKYRLNKRLKEAMDREQEVREWAYDRVPDAVSGLLREKKQASQPESETPASWDHARIISLPDAAE